MRFSGKSKIMQNNFKKTKPTVPFACQQTEALTALLIFKLTRRE